MAQRLLKLKQDMINIMKPINDIAEAPLVTHNQVTA